MEGGEGGGVRKVLDIFTFRRSIMMPPDTFRQRQKKSEENENPQEISFQKSSVKLVSLKNVENS